MRARRWSGQAAVTSFLISIVVAGVGVASPYELRCSQECTSEACLAQCAHSGPKHTLRTEEQLPPRAGRIGGEATQATHHKLQRRRLTQSDAAAIAEAAGLTEVAPASGEGEPAVASALLDFDGFSASPSPPPAPFDPSADPSTIVWPPARCAAPWGEPLIIGGQGGSGTRSVYELLEALKHVEFPPHSNDTHDCIALRVSGLIDGGPGFPTENPTLHKVIAATEGIDYDLRDLGTVLGEQVAADLCRFLTDPVVVNASEIAIDRRVVWGWKEPVSIYLLPVWHKAFGGDFRLLHVVRDVRSLRSAGLHFEMQREFQEGFLGKQWTGSPEELTRLYGDQSAGDDRWRWHRFVKLWAQSQLQVANWADKHLPDGHYFRLRIEDLTSRRNTVEQKVALVRRLMKWIGREVSVLEARSVLHVFAGNEHRYELPTDMSVDDVDWIRRAAGPALVRFGYSTKEEMHLMRSGKRAAVRSSLPNFVTGLAHLRGERKK